MIRAVLEFLRAWWRVDRIRASPRDGRLLRLHPPCFVLIGDRSFEIGRRVVGQDADGPFVVYDGRDANGPAKLLVRLVTKSSRTVIRWIGNNGERTLDETDISVFEPIPSPNGLRARKS